MDRRSAFALLACCALVAASGRAGARDISVYGIELEVSAERERLLIFADAPLSPQLLPVDERTLMVALPGSVLDPSAPTQIVPKEQGTVVRVTAFERAEGKREVRVVVQRRPGAEPRVEKRASVVALDFDALPRAAAGGPDTIRIAYKNTPIFTVVTDLARATGESLVFDEAMSALGGVTIEGPPQVTRGEALALIDSILLLRGFAAVPAPGGVRKIVQINGAPSPWTLSGKIPDSDAPITTMLRLENAAASDILAILTPYLGANSFAAAYEPTNSLIMSGPASLLRTLRKSIQVLDQNVTGAPLIWPMRVANAQTVAAQLLEIAGERDVPFTSFDARMNALLLRVRPGETERIRSIVDRLDRPAHGAASVQVVKLRYADPKDLAERLTALRDSRGGGSASEGGDAAAARAGLRGLAFEAVADGPTHSLVLSGPPESLSAVLDVVSELDRVPASVRVEVTIAMIDLDDRLDLGTDYFIPTLTNPKGPDDLIATVLQNPSGGGIPSGPSTDRPIVAAFTRAPLLVTLVDPTTNQTVTIPLPREKGTISMNGRTVNSNTLMRPNLLITSGEEHEIFAGDNIPIPVSHSGASTGTGGTPTTQQPSLVVRKDIERQDVGTTLRLTPTVGEQGGVTLELHLELSALGESAAGSVEDVGPTINQIVVDSKIRLRGAGEIAVIGSSARPQVQRTETGVPWLKDIPVLGWAFRLTQDETRKRHLLIAARAEILRPESRDLADELARELGAPAPAARAEP